VVEESFQTYTEYLEIEKEIKELNSLEKEVKTEAVKTETKSKEKKQTKLSYKEQQDFDTLPDEIEALEEEMDQLNACLQNPECYQKKGLNVITEELALLEETYEEKSDRYLDVLEIFESLV